MRCRDEASGEVLQDISENNKSTKLWPMVVSYRLFPLLISASLSSSLLNDSKENSIFDLKAYSGRSVISLVLHAFNLTDGIKCMGLYFL
jgi:hypothetical protein